MMNTNSLKLVLPFFVLSVLSHQPQVLGFDRGFRNVPVKCIEREREALLALKEGLVDNYSILSSWSSGENHKECCEWEGVQCNNQTGHVEKLDLHGTDKGSLQGKLSPALTQLRYLQYLDLSYTDFLLSHIPKSIASLTHLRYLNLSQCYFGGQIPKEFGNLSLLQHLDLQSNLLDGKIPAQLSNLSQLTYFDLTYNDFAGTIPHQFSNLSSLQYLSIGPFVLDLESNLEWVSHLSSSLRHLSLEQIDLSSASDWPQLVANLPHLQELYLRGCNLPNITKPLSKYVMNHSDSLTIIDLSDNKLTSSIYPWLMSFRNKLAVLELNSLITEGPIPEAIGNLSSLRELWLGDNKHEGRVPRSLWDLCSLREVHLFGSALSGLFDEFVPTVSQCAKNSLKILDVSGNQITGTLPNLSHLSSLQQLIFDGNKINGTLTESIGQLSDLEVLSAYKNSLQGLLSEAHFSKLYKLRNLDLTFNAFIFNVSVDWVPPFQLQYMYLAGSKLGPHFPSWLRTQKRCVWMDISSAEIAGTVPQWFWNLSLSFDYFNISNNQLTGQIPDLPLQFIGYPQIDLGSNLFRGKIPSFLSSSRSLYLSNNNFTELSSLLYTRKAQYLFLLDLSNNQLSELPNCWMNLASLSFLNLANNNLFGRIPSSMGLLGQIRSLHLRNNYFIGEMPLGLSNCTELMIFDVGHNNLSGPIPLWIGDKLQKLLILILQSNQLYGTLPSNICLLAQIRILDLSLNNISGSIPRCENNLSALAFQTSANATISYYYNSAGGATSAYDDSALVTWKGREREYKNTLGLLKSIDFSSNKFVGEIPSEIMSLVGLVSLNLSRNKLTGKIPSSIGQLNSLDALDLSRNFLFGSIPSSLSEVDRLSMLDLSYNNLSGKIPVGTQLQSFNVTVFMGNPELCGLPLPKRCPDKQMDVDQKYGNDKDDDQFVNLGFFISLLLGFAVGFWGVCGSLMLRRP